MWVAFLFFGMTSAFAGPEGALVRASKSLLTAQKFPKTFSDIAFVDRVAVLQEGYEPWESEFDASGRCIRGCAYVGMTMESELDMMQRQTELATQDLRTRGLLPDESGQKTENTVGAPGQKHVPIPAPTPSDIHASCSPRHSGIQAAQVAPIGEPVMGRPAITSPFGPRIHPVTGAKQNHNGVDFGVPSGTDVFAPADGTVTNVWTDNTCGMGIKISHADRYETLYCHLGQHLVKKGDVVHAGCRIAKSGNSGRTTGAHLHYTIKHNGTAINPAPLIGR